MTQGFFQFNNFIINEIIKFATSSFDLLFMSGSKGTSKSETIAKVLEELKEDNLIFRHFCFENSVIDDFLLNFYDALRSFSLAQKISLKKFTTDNFTEKVSHYFKTIDANCIVTVENFEKVENNLEIIDFLSHLASYTNVKIIVVSRNAEKNLFRFKQIKMKTLNIEQITKDEFKSRLTILLEPMDEQIKETFYEITQGLELYLKMSIKYCATTGVSIKDLINEYERKSTNFEEFIVTKFVSLTPSVYQDLFKILCALSHPVDARFLNEYKLGNVNHIEYLSKNFLISKFKDEFYVKDYFKQYITKTFSIQEKATYYKNLVKIYENELTKSPKDRLLRLSREAIRKEIDFLKASIPSINSQNQKAFSYLGIAAPTWNEDVRQKSKLSEKFNKIKERKNALSKKDKELLISKRLEDTNQKSLIDENKEKNRRFVIELINSSRQYSKQYRYQDAISELKRALGVDYDNEFRIEILVLLAKNYEALNDYTISRTHYEQALEIAVNTKDLRRCELEYLIAQTNKSLYKIDAAKEQFKVIAANDSNSAKYRAMASLELGEIEEANSNINSAIRHYQNALSLTLGKNKELVAKSYYKLAVLYDENQDSENAVKYYQKNYTTSSEKNENKYYSASLTNLALIYIEQGKYKDASEFLKLALAFDSENNDLENMYFSQKELAKLYCRIDSTSALGYFKQALDSANKLNDDFKIALVYFEAGEFYYDRQEDERALINFLNAKIALKNNPHDENIARIDLRIKDIKMRLDEMSFNSIMEKYDKN